MLLIVGFDAVLDLEAKLQAAPYSVPSGTFTDANIACQGPEEAMRTLEWQPQVHFSQGNQADGSNDATPRSLVPVVDCAAQNWARASAMSARPH